MADTTVIQKPVIFSTALFITFLVLKLCKVITWSWWVVTLPLWAGPAILIAAVTLILIAAGIAAVVARLLE